MNLLHVHGYSIEVAKIFGVKSAVYLSFLWAVMATATDPTKVSFPREYMFAHTGLSVDEQKEVENALNECGIISIQPFKGNTDKVYCSFHQERFNSMTSFKGMLGEEKSDIPKTEKKRVGRPTAKESMTKTLKSALNEDNQVVRQYMCDWIDSVQANPKIFMSLQGMKLSIDALNNSAQSDDEKIEILKIAIRRGWKDLEWAINEYKKSQPRNEAGMWQTYSETKADRISTENGAF